MYRSGFTDRVRVLSGPRGPGLWVPDRLAGLLGLRVGDPARLTDARGRPFDSTVAAIYTDLRSAPDTAYWCSSRALYRGPAGLESGDAPVLDMLLTDRETFLAVTGEMGAVPSHAGYAIERTGDVRGLGQANLRRVAGGLDAMRRELTAAPLPDDTPWLRARFDSDLGPYVRRAGRVGRSLRPVALATSGAAVAVGLAVLAAAAAFWVQRRRRELRVLAAHGVGAGALGGKAAIEAALPLVLGTAGGWLVAWLLVRHAGPSPLVDPAAARAGALATAAVLAAALLVTGVTAALGARPLTDRAARPRRRLRILGWLPVRAAQQPGSFTVLMGPSGSGKSTLLRLLAGLDRPDAGSVTIDGTEISRLSRRRRVSLRRRRLGFLFQSPADNLLEYLTVRQHLDLAARLRGVPVASAGIEDLLARLGLDERADHLPRQLSGGEQQRAGIAFAAIGPPALLVADEPTGQLDHSSVDGVLDAFRTLARDGVTVIATTHDPAVAARADRVLHMRDGLVAEPLA